MTVGQKLGVALGIAPMLAWCVLVPWLAPVWVWSGYTVWTTVNRR